MLRTVTFVDQLGKQLRTADINVMNILYICPIQRESTYGYIGSQITLITNDVLYIREDRQVFGPN